jgi:hypothetical protein
MDTKSLPVMPKCKQYNSIFEKEVAFNMVRNNENYVKYYELTMVTRENWSILQHRISTKKSLLFDRKKPNKLVSYDQAMGVLSKSRADEVTILAGGAVVSAIYGLPIKDFDYFCVLGGHYYDDEVKMADHIQSKVMMETGKGLKDIYRNNFTITFTVEGLGVQQYVLKLHGTTTEILYNFDIDTSCILFDGKNIYVSDRFLYAVNKGYNSVNLKCADETYEKRLIKYAAKGFPIFIQGYGKLQDQLTHNQLNLGVEFMKSYVFGHHDELVWKICDKKFLDLLVGLSLTSFYSLVLVDTYLAKINNPGYGFMTSVHDSGDGNSSEMLYTKSGIGITRKFNKISHSQGSEKEVIDWIFSVPSAIYEQFFTTSPEAIPQKVEFYGKGGSRALNVYHRLDTPANVWWGM